MAEQELGALEAFRQLGGDRARGHAGAGEADQRVRFREIHIAQDGERGEHAAGRRVSENGNVWNTLGPKSLECGHGLGQLHQGERSLLHPRTARCRDHDERDSLVQGGLGGSRDLFAHHAAHRAAHEREVHYGDRHSPGLDGADPPHGRIAHPGGQLSSGNAIGIRLLVDEAKRIQRLQALVALLEAVAIKEQAEPRACRQAEVVAAAGADPVHLVELLVEQHLAAARALRPQVGGIGVAASAERRQLDRHQSRPRRAIAPEAARTARWRCARRTARSIAEDVGRLLRQAT